MAVVTASTIIAFNDGTPSHTTCSAEDGPAAGAAICGVIGRLHCGQTAAEVDT